MKIAFPFTGNSIGGSHRSIIEIFRELKKINIECVFVLHENEKILSKVLNYENIPYLNFPLKNIAGEKPNYLSIIYRLIIHLPKIVKFIKKNKIDIIHGNDFGINLTWSFAVKFTDSKFVWHQRQPLSLTWKYKIINFLCDYLIANSDFVMSTVPNNIKNKSRVIYNFFDTTKIYNKKESNLWLKKKYTIASDSYVIGYVGRVTQFKKTLFLLEAFNKILSFYEKQNLKLIVAGNIDKKYFLKIKKIISKYSIEKKIIFTNHINDPLKVFAALDIVIMPTTNEAFGRTLIEAMSQSTAIIASNSGGHLEIIEEWKNGIFFEKNNVDDLVKKCVSLLNNNKKRTYLQKSAKKYFDVHFSNNTNDLNQIVSIYRNLNN